VLVHAVWHVSGRGPDATMEFSVLNTLRKGRVILVEYFWDHEEALEALGPR
jgi:hypothetical protein